LAADHDLVRTRTPGLAVALARLAPGARVLDAACGTGLDLVALERNGHRVVGADASPAMLREAAARTDAELVLSTWEDLPGRVTGPFDAVLCVGNSLPHLATAEERRTALAAFAGLLAPDGFLVVDSHDWELLHAEGSGAIDGVGGRRFAWRVPERFGEPYVLTITAPSGASYDVVSHPFTRDQLLAEVAAAGLEVAEVVTEPGDDRYTLIARRG
jgi:glycine/sarcosine N-methyltransferase/sarcosine/dimethylglycine N-methyltransferase